MRSWTVRYLIYSSWLSYDKESVFPRNLSFTTFSPLPPLPVSMEPSSSTCTSGAAGRSPSLESPLPSISNQAQSDVVPDLYTPSHDHIPRPTFSTPQKLVPVEQVMKECPGVDMAALRKLAGALARDAIFGKDELCASSLKGGRKSKTN